MTAWDEQGRPTRWVTSREVEWDGRERAWMLALDLYEGTLCRKCGQPLAECTDPDNDPDNPDAGHQYVAEDPTECFSCKALVRSEEKWSKSEPDSAPYMIHTVVKVAKPTRRRRRGRNG
ncbi:hypothetical protein ACFYUR_18780 [Micromonospora haikouensis]|uniref:hypothetical protein n=1 Tax=Micromonospora haikouensis TaxID=686309 RepID=UPI00369F1DF2